MSKNQKKKSQFDLSRMFFEMLPIEGKIPIIFDRIRFKGKLYLAFMVEIGEDKEEGTE